MFTNRNNPLQFLIENIQKHQVNRVIFVTILTSVYRAET
jgi:hypothetical protein